MSSFQEKFLALLGLLLSSSTVSVCCIHLCLDKWEYCSAIKRTKFCHLQHIHIQHTPASSKVKKCLIDQTCIPLNQHFYFLGFMLEKQTTQHRFCTQDFIIQKYFFKYSKIIFLSRSIHPPIHTYKYIHMYMHMCAYI